MTDPTDEQGGHEIKLSGRTVLKIDGQNTYLGRNAGIANTTGGLNTFLGDGAGQSNTTGGENTFVGTIAGQFVTTGGFNTAVGEHALGYEDASHCNTAIGNDAMRNWVSPGGNTAVGKSAMLAGGGANNTAVGCSAMQGASSTIVLGGTPTEGDMLNLTFTGSFTGSPTTVSYTVPSGSITLAEIAAGLVRAIRGKPALVDGPFGIIPAIIDNSNIILVFPGSATTGSAITVHALITGAATETLTVLGGVTGFDNVAIGSFAVRGLYMTAAWANVAIGKSTLERLTTGSGNVAAGLATGRAVTSGSKNVLVGDCAGIALSTASNVVAIGPSTIANNVEGGNHVAVGSAAMHFYNGRFGDVHQASVAVGAEALKGTAPSSYHGNVAVGGGAGSRMSTGSKNTILGSSTGHTLTTGNGNTLLGSAVGSANLRTGSGNIYVGASSAIDAVSPSESNVFRLGNHPRNLIRATDINSANPAFFLDWLPASPSFDDDRAAAAGGIEVGQIYRNGSAIHVRVS